MALRRKASKKPSSSSTAPKAESRPPGLITQLSNPRTLRRLLLVAKVIGPAVAAGAMKSSTEVRGLLDDRRARQLGVPVEDVAAYKGPAGAIQARITGLSTAVNELRARRAADPRVARFADTTTTRLGELSAAATATLSMPPSTRRTALRAVSADLDQLDSELMTFLVGSSTS